MTDADQGGEWVTGITGESFQLDAKGDPIIQPPSDEPTESPDPEAILKAIEELDRGGGLGDSTPGSGLGDLMPTGILGGSGQIGGNDDETQKEIWAEMDRGEFGTGAGAGSIPPDAETLL